MTYKQVGALFSRVMAVIVFLRCIEWIPMLAYLLQAAFDRKSTDNFALTELFVNLGALGILGGLAWFLWFLGDRFTPAVAGGGKRIDEGVVFRSKGLVLWGLGVYLVASAITSIAERMGTWNSVFDSNVFLRLESGSSVGPVVEGVIGIIFIVFGNRNLLGYMSIPRAVRDYLNPPYDKEEEPDDGPRDAGGAK